MRVDNEEGGLELLFSVYRTSDICLVIKNLKFGIIYNLHNTRKIKKLKKMKLR